VATITHTHTHTHTQVQHSLASVGLDQPHSNIKNVHLQILNFSWTFPGTRIWQWNMHNSSTLLSIYIQYCT